MQWLFEDGGIDWAELSELYRIAPLGNKSSDRLKQTYANSLRKCFVLDDGRIIGAGRVVGDGLDTAYLCDVVVHPERQGEGLGKALVLKLTELSAGHRKIILYANPGKEDFYRKLGFRRMLTAMAIFEDQEGAIQRGLLEDV
ncbi:GNAT family N-acetyltransferase [Dongia sp. agr-C8]